MLLFALICSYLLLFLASFTSVTAQCTNYDINISSSGFGCNPSEGLICITTNGIATQNFSDCVDYDMEIEFPIYSFNVTSYSAGIRPFTLYNQTSTTTTLRCYDPFLNQDATGSHCIEGDLLIANTQFTVRIVHPITNHIVEEIDFFVDDFVTVGAANTTVLLSSVAGTTLEAMPAAATTSQKVKIEGTLVIDQSYTFGSDNANSHLEMGSNSRIEVNNNRLLRLTETDISTCSTTWDGIEVKNGGSLIFDRSSIEDATVAIEMKDNSAVDIYNSRFSNNTTSIGSFDPNPKNLTLNLFSTPFNQTMIENGQYGIFLENTSPLIIQGFYNFRNLTNGIVADGSDVFVKWANFQDTQNGVVVSDAPTSATITDNQFLTSVRGIYIDGVPSSTIDFNTILDADEGIRIQNQNINEETEISGNNIFQCNSGVVGVGIKQGQGIIENNNIRAFQRGVNILGTLEVNDWQIINNPDISSTGMGVRLQNIRTGRIENNTIIYGESKAVSVVGGDVNHTINNDVISDDDGINYALSTNGIISCNNSVSDLGILIQSNNSGTDIRGNDLIGDDISLQYGLSALSSFAHTGQQAFKGNRFALSTPSLPTAINYSDPTTANMNQYIIGNLAAIQGSNDYPYFQALIFNWFLKLGGKDYSCPPEFGGGGGSEGDNANSSSQNEESLINAIENDLLLISSGLEEAYGPNIAFEAKFIVAKHILELQSSFNNFTYEEVLLEQEFDEVSQLAQIFFNISEFQKDLKRISSQDFQDFVEVVRNDSTLIINSDSSLDQLDLQSVSEIRDTYESYSEAFQSNIIDNNIEIVQFVESIQIQLEETNVTENYGFELKSSLAFLLEFLHPEFDFFSSVGQEEINRISNLCFTEFGFPVVYARSLRAIYDKESILQDFSDCELVEPRLKSTEEDLNWKLYPNPTSENITIQHPEKGAHEIRIFDNLGKLMLQVSGIGQETKLDLTEFRSGVYFISIDNSLVKRFIKI